ncbi:MAG: AAA family ATPase [Candidatus Weimeria sp.]
MAAPCDRITTAPKVSIFSDLNQLSDISMDDEFSGICGITEVFEPEIEALASEQVMSHEACLTELAKMYDGYHFSANGIGVYNPFSLLSAFSRRDFGSYWFETGTPDILIKKLETSQMPLYKLSEGVTATESALMNYRVDDPDPIPMFYQSGYLTICDYDREFRLYTLKLPNNEVKYGFLDSLIPSVLGYRNDENPASLRNMLMDLRGGKPESFLNCLISLFASIPYPEGRAPAYEGEWSRQLYLILSLMGVYTQCEVHMATGRADCVVHTPDYIYVFEFKLDASVEEAMAQIDDKGYTIPYTSDARKMY